MTVPSSVVSTLHDPENWSAAVELTARDCEDNGRPQAGP